MFSTSKNHVVIDVIPTTKGLDEIYELVDHELDKLDKNDT